MNQYHIYKDKLNTGELFIIEISNNNNKPIQIVVKYVNDITKNINKKIKNNKSEPNTCYIIIDYKDFRKTKEIIIKAWQDLKKIKLKDNIKILYSNRTEYRIATYIQENMNSVIIEIEKIYERILEKIITKEENGIPKEYIKRDSDTNNPGYIIEGITADEMYNYYKKLSKEISNQKTFSTMSIQEIINFIIDKLAENGNYKKHYLKEIKDSKETTLKTETENNNNNSTEEDIPITKNDPEDPPKTENRIFTKETTNKLSDPYNALEPKKNILALPNLIFILSGILLLISIILFLLSTQV